MEASIAAVGVRNLVAMMGQPLGNEASLVFNFREDFKWMTRELNLMKTYLQDAQQKSGQINAVKQWLGELADVVFDAEDIVGECAAQSPLCALSCSGFIFKHKIGRRIRNLKARISSIDAVATRLQLLPLFRGVGPTEEASTSSSRGEQWKRSSLLESNARPVAIEAKVDEILSLLDDAAHNVIGVVGMGGVGKTFLLQNVYNDPRTTATFEKCIWLSISQTYSLQKLQSDIAFRLGLRDVVKSSLTEQTVAELIRECLHGKKFLIVLDDVWRATEHDNLIERLGLPVANTQGKIVVTTRSKEVCRVMNALSIYYMEVLREQDSWDLFCLYAFYPQNTPPDHLKEVARQVESKCGNLPLALKTVGASMANQTRANQWESMLHKLKTVRNTQDPIMEILQLSYDFLPADLKACFLYLSFFGEDEQIHVEYLIELWIAEGFIPEGDDGREIGLKYYYQLSNLCLVEAWEDELLYKYCKMHDLVRDLAIYICKENKCAFNLQNGCIKYFSSCTQCLSPPDKSSGCRRIFLAKQGLKDDDISDSMLLFPSFLRTVSLRRNNKIENIPSIFFSKVRALRVLDLSYTRISSLPSSIGCLKLLKVLTLWSTNINKVPKCIRSLKNLRVLWILGRTITRVPDWIGELKCLENLWLNANSMPKTISKLLSLRVLPLNDLQLSVKANGLLRLQDVANLISLQNLYIKVNCQEELQKLEEGMLERLENMREIGISNVIPTPANSVDVRRFPENLTSMKHLEHLWLTRFVLPSSRWICEFVNLTVLVLVDCECSEYPAVESLPNLISLQLWTNKICREVRKSFGKCGAFPKLRILRIDNFPMLEEFPVLEGGSMPCLEQLRLISCTKVGRVPDGLDQLKSLKVFDFSGSGTTECKERLKEEGEEWKRKMKANNPRVRIYI